MKKNMGFIDKVIRVAVVIVIAILYFTGRISGVLALVLGLVSVIFLITSAIGTCPLYIPMGISTIKKDK